MLNQLLRFTLVSSLLLWLRPRWRGLLALVVYVVMVHVLHGEYLGYVELSGRGDFLVWSYLLKWVALGGGLLAYFILAMRGAAISSIRQGRKATQSSVKPIPPNTDSTPDVDDGFEFLRRKRHLDSRAEQILRDEK